MRTDISSNISNAAAAASINTSVSLDIYKSRCYFDSTMLSDTVEPDFSESPGIPSEPLAQDVKYCTRLDDLIAIYSYENQLQLQTSSSGAEVILSSGSPLDTYDLCRPSIFCGESLEHVFYTSSSGIYLLQTDGFSVSSNTLITSSGSPIWDRGYASLHAVGETDVIALWIDDGGVGVSRIYYDTDDWVLDDWGYRFIDPTHLFTASSSIDTYDDDLYSLHFSAAVKDAEERIYIYYTRYDGRVDAIIINEYGEWSDRFTAIPSDLSVIKLTNAFIAPNGNICLAGQFQRVDDTGSFSSDYIYNFILVSPDGRSFSLDRNVLVSIGNDEMETAGTSMAYRFFACVDDDTPENLYLFSSGRVASQSAPFFLTDDAEKLEIPANKTLVASGSFNGTISLTIPDPLEQYIDHDWIRNGYVVDIYLAYMIAAGTYEKLLLRRSIIDSIDIPTDESSRRVVISTEPLSQWRVTEMSHPFYLELNSKQSIYDDVDAWDNLYQASSSDGLPTFLSVDFWDEGTLAPNDHAGTQVSTTWTNELTEKGYVKLPAILTLPFNIEVYGWSRSGSATPYTGGSGDQPSSSDAQNDVISVKLHIRRGENAEETEIHVQDYVTSSHFPRTWYTSEDGARPVILQATEAQGFQEGDEILRIGVVASNPNSSDHTVFYIERVDMPDILVQLPQSGEIWTEAEAEEISLGDPNTFTFETDDQDWVDSIGWAAYEFTPATRYWEAGALHIYCPAGSFWKTGKWKFTFTDNKYIPMTGDFAITFEVYTDMYGGGVAATFTDDEGWEQQYRIDLDDTKSAEWRTVTFTSANIINTPEGTWRGKRLKSIQFGALGGAVGANDLMSCTSVSITGFDGDQPQDILVAGQQLLRCGVPIIRLSTTPYTTFDCMVGAQYKITKTNLVGGVVCLAADGDNYIAATAELDKISLIKCRGGIRYTITEVENTITENYFWIMLEFRGGVFRIFISENIATPTFRDPVLEYEWTYDDGEICTSDDLMHVGTYSLIDTPWVQITGFDPSVATHIGILPQYSIDDFPNSGTLIVNGDLLTYGHRHSDETEEQEGPFQCRNTIHTYNYTSYDGKTYSGSAIEFTRFEWLDNPTYYNKFSGKLMASNIGHAYEISSTDFKPWIRTGGKLVILKNRGRFFADDIEGNVHGYYQKMWITNGFGGVAFDDDDQSLISEGDVAFLYGDDYELRLSGFFASSGEIDATVEDMITRVMYMSASVPKFPGDVIIATLDLTGTDYEVTP